MEGDRAALVGLRREEAGTGTGQESIGTKGIEVISKNKAKGQVGSGQELQTQGGAGMFLSRKQSWEPDPESC